jgi:hypothetical protein
MTLLTYTTLSFWKQEDADYDPEAFKLRYGQMKEADRERRHSHDNRELQTLQQFLGDTKVG